MLKFKTLFLNMILMPIFAALLSGCQLTPQAQEEYDPDRAALARLKLGLAYLSEASESNDNIKKAHYHLNLANQYSPYNPKVMLGLAMFDQYVGENDEADQIYQNIIKLEPNNGLYAVHYGTFLCQTQHEEQAEKILTRVINSGDQTWKSDAIEQLGYCYVHQNQQEKAQETFQTLFKRDPSKRSQVQQIGAYYIEKGKSDEGNWLIEIAK